MAILLNLVKSNVERHVCTPSIICVVRVGTEPRPAANHYTTAPLCIYRLAVLTEHRRDEDISSVTTLQDSKVRHNEILHDEMQYSGESSAMFLTIMNLYPSDPSCIYTAVQFVSSLAKQYDATLILTFDQPL